MNPWPTAALYLTAMVLILFVELDFHQYIYYKEKIVLKVARVITLDLRES